MELGSILESTIKIVRTRYPQFLNIIEGLSSSRILNLISNEARESLLLAKTNWGKSHGRKTKHKSKNKTESGQELLQQLSTEIECISCSIWAVFLTLVGGAQSPLADLELIRTDLLRGLQTRLDGAIKLSNITIAALTSNQDSKDTKKVGSGVAGVGAGPGVGAGVGVGVGVGVAGTSGSWSNPKPKVPVNLCTVAGDKTLSVPKGIKTAVDAASRALGLLPTVDFVKQSVLLWNVLSDQRNSLTVLSGPISSGKSSIRMAALKAIQVR